MKSSLLLASAGSVLAYSCTNKLPNLAQACGRDYEKFCSNADKTNLVSMLACGKSHQADLGSECMAEIQKDFSALFACAEDLATYCPSFGKVSVSQWSNDAGSGRRHRQAPSVTPPTSTSIPPPASPSHDPAVPSSSMPPAVDPVYESDERLPSSSSQDVSASESYTDYFTWDYYISEDFSENFNSVDSSNGIDSLHSRKTEDSQQCFVKSYTSFSAPCLNAIAEQWATVQAAKGVTGSSAPSADEAYSIMAPPVAEHSQWKKMNRALSYAALAFFVCTLITCLCCCCRRCKKRRAVRIVPTQDQEIVLSQLPEVVLPMAAPTRYIPLATTVPVVSRAHPVYTSYTGQGLAAHVPVAQPVHV